MRGCAADDAPHAAAEIERVVKLLARLVTCLGAGDQLARVDAGHGFGIVGIDGEHGGSVASHAVIELRKPAWDILEDVHGAVVEVHALNRFVGEADCDVVCAHSVCLLRDQANKGCALNVGAHEEVLSGLERASGFDDEAGVGAQFRVELFVAFVRWAYGEVCHAGPLFRGRTVSRGCVRLNGLYSARVYAFAVRVRA